MLEEVHQDPGQLPDRLDGVLEHGGGHGGGHPVGHVGEQLLDGVDHAQLRHRQPLLLLGLIWMLQQGTHSSAPTDYLKIYMYI